VCVCVCVCVCLCVCLCVCVFCVCDLNGEQRSNLSGFPFVLRLF